MTDSERTTPRQNIAAECQRRGKSAVVSGCIDLLEGREVDDGLILALGGPAAEYVLSGHEGGREGYWPRVWAARGLLYAWDDGATAAIISWGVSAGRSPAPTRWDGRRNTCLTRQQDSILLTGLHP